MKRFTIVGKVKDGALIFLQFQVSHPGAGFETQVGGTDIHLLNISTH